MPTNTTNFSLIKPGQEEFYNVDVPNANMDTIDGVLKALQDAISSGASEQDLKELRDALATHISEIATLTKVGHVMLSNLINGSSDTKAATELAVKNAIAHVKAWGRSKITEGSLQTDPNITDLSLILVQGHPNAPTGGIWYISTFFYYADPSNAKSQIAVSYNKDYGRGMYWRDCFGGVWQPWVKILDSTMINVPNGVVGLDASGKLPTGIGSNIATGTYTGDGSTLVKSINVGFTPKFLIVMGSISNNNYYPMTHNIGNFFYRQDFMGFGSDAGSYYPNGGSLIGKDLSAASKWDQVTQFPIIVPNGFTVRDFYYAQDGVTMGRPQLSLNKSNGTYSWVAYG